MTIAASSTIRHIPSDIIGLSYGIESTFGTAPSAGSYVNLRARNIKFEPTQSMHEYSTQKSLSALGPDPSVPGAEGGTLTFDVPVRGGNGTVSELARLAKYTCNYSNRGNVAAGVVTGGSASTVTVGSSATTLAYTVGDVIGVLNAAGTVLQMRMITSVTDGTPISFTVAPDFDTAPVNGDAIVSVDSLTPKTGTPSSYLSFRLVQNAGGGSAHVYIASGCAGSFKMDSTADGIPFASFSFMVDRWESSESTIADDAVSADTLASPKPMLGSPCYAQGSNGTWYRADTESFSFDAGISIAPISTQHGTHGRTGWLVVGNQPKPSIKPYWDRDWLTKLSGATTFGLAVESIKDGNEGWFFFAPEVQVVKASMGDIQGIQAHEMDLKIVYGGTGLDNSTVVQIPQWVIGITSYTAET